MTRQFPVLLDVLSEIPDFRQSQGRRHPLQSVLALAVCAMLCGYRSYGAIAEWGRNYSRDLTAALGFRHQRTPCAATFNTIFRQLNREEVESKLGQWAQSIFAKACGPRDDLKAIAIDGKTLRGSRGQGASSAHLLSALGHHLGLTLFQQAVEDKTNEITAVQDVLNALVLEGRVITVDALLTQREVAQTVIDRGGDYLMVVKGNQATLEADIKFFFEERGFRQKASIVLTWGRLVMVELSSGDCERAPPWLVIVTGRGCNKSLRSDARSRGRRAQSSARKLCTALPVCGQSRLTLALCLSCRGITGTLIKIALG